MAKGMTKREKILIGVLIAVIVLLGWYKLIYQPISEKNDQLESEIAAEQTENDIMVTKIAQMEKMENELEVLRESGDAQPIPLYDNSKELMNSLHKVLAGTQEYDLQFGEPDADDYIVIHTINLTFKVDSYKKARQIIDNLATNTYANQISDVTIDLDDGAEVTMTITFFEVNNDATPAVTDSTSEDSSEDADSEEDL